MPATPPDAVPEPAPAAEGRPRRRGGPQLVFTVERTERLTPHLVRVHLGGEAVAAFVSGADPDKLLATDRYVKMVFAPAGSSLTPPFDLEALRETLPIDELPVRRTYTVRSVDEAQGTIAIDFVVHGADGVAGPWAASARPGDLVALSGPGGGYRPTSDPEIVHVLLADDSALPAVTAALEAMVPDARGVALLEVDAVTDELPVRAPAGVDVRWLHRSAGSGLVASLRELPRPQGEVAVFAHGEREAMKSVRRILQGDWGLERRQMSLSAYWAAGRAEDAFQAEKREPIGQVFD